jgi:pimeloyl-ACP methyl ester carboxylesterase
MLAKPEFMAWWTWCMQDAFKNGVDGYVDDRLADRDGWGTFDVRRITCPVTVFHGAIDGMLPTANARHTAAIVPGATLRIFDDLGHISVGTKAVEMASHMLSGIEVLGTGR